MNSLEQLTLFEPQSRYKPGDFVKPEDIGRQLNFDELSPGALVILDVSTQSHKWYQLHRVEKIIWNQYENCRRLILYHGKPQRSYINKRWFRDPGDGERGVRMYELREGNP